MCYFGSYDGDEAYNVTEEVENDEQDDVSYYIGIFFLYKIL